MSSPFPRDFVKILGTKFSSRPSKETETIRGGTFHETKSFPFACPRRCSAPCSRAARGRRPARLRRTAAIRSLRPKQKRAVARCRVVAVSEGNTLLLADVDSERGDIYTLDAGELSLVARSGGARRAARRRSACGRARWSRSPSAAIFWRAIPHCSAGWSASPSCRTNLTTAARSTCVC